MRLFSFVLKGGCNKSLLEWDGGSEQPGEQVLKEEDDDDHHEATAEEQQPHGTRPPVSEGMQLAATVHSYTQHGRLVVPSQLPAPGRVGQEGQVGHYDAMRLLHVIQLLKGKGDVNSH